MNEKETLEQMIERLYADCCCEPEYLGSCGACKDLAIIERIIDERDALRKMRGD